MKLNFSFDSIHNALISDKYKRNLEDSEQRKRGAKYVNYSMDVGRRGAGLGENSLLEDTNNVLEGINEMNVQTEIVGNQVGGDSELPREKAVQKPPARDIKIPNLSAVEPKESKIFNFKKISDNEQINKEQRELQALKQQMKTQYRIFRKSANYDQMGSPSQEMPQRGRFNQFRTMQEYSKQTRFSPIRNSANYFEPRSHSMTKGREERESMNLPPEMVDWNRRVTRKLNFGGPTPMNLNASPGMSLKKLQNSGSTLKQPKRSHSRGYNNFINVSVPSQYIILQGNSQAMEMPMMKRAVSVKQSKFMNNFTADHYINLTQIRKSNLRNNSYQNSEHGSRSPHAHYSRGLSPMGSRPNNGSFGSNTMGGLGNSFTPVYANYVQSTLPQVEELHANESRVGQFQSTISWIPSSINDLLLLLFKKILVYNSKIESLQKKIHENNPNFSVKVLFKEIDKERKAFLTPHDMGYFLHYFGFRVSDWETFKMMGFLSSHRISTLQELISSEGANAGVSGVVQSKYFGENNKLSSLSLAKNSKTKVFINYESFSRLFKPMDRSFRPNFQKKPQTNYSMAKGIKESEFYLIRQIILLTFRKIDEIGMILQYLRKHPSEDIFELLCRFNEGMYNRQSEGSHRFDSDDHPQKRRQTNPDEAENIKRLKSVSEVISESALQDSLSQMLSKPPAKGKSDAPKSKKPVIKKSKLDLKKKQKSLNKSNASIKQSTVINKAIPKGKLPEKKETTKKQIWPNQKTFENFLNHHKIRFLKKDTVFLLRDLGALGDCLYEDRFKRFLFSNVWEA